MSPNPHFDSTAIAPPRVLVAEQRQLFQRVLHALNRGDIHYAIGGAFALQHYTGIWHATKDLDIFLPAESIEAALKQCRAAGMVTEMTDPVWLGKASAGGYFVDFITGMSNGVLWVTPDWVHRARPGEVLSHHVRLLAPEEMILSKMFVTRRQRFDGSDICHLIYCCGERLDWDHVVRAAGEHWELLAWHLVLFRYVYPGAAQMVPAGLWLSLLDRLRIEPRPTGEFRGSLLDPFMFEIDVEKWGFDSLEDTWRKRRLEAVRGGAATTDTAPKRAA